MSSTRPAAVFCGSNGSQMSALTIPTASACPAARMRSACWGSLTLPATRTGTETTFFAFSREERYTRSVSSSADDVV